MFCGNCGSQLKDDAAFCNLCGSSMTEQRGQQAVSGAQDTQQPADVTAVIDSGATTVMPPVDDKVPTAAWPAATPVQPQAQVPPSQPDWVAQPQYQPQPQYTTPPPRTAGNGMMITAIVIAAVLVLGAGGFALWKTGVIGGDKESSATTAEDKKGDTAEDADDLQTTDDGDTAAQDDATTDSGGDVVVDDTSTNGDAGTPESYDISYSATLKASSQLPGSQGVTYDPENLLDDRGDTCWAENAGGYGVGEYVQFSYSSPVTVTGIDVMPGYDKFKDVDRWYSNGRVKKARVEFSDGTSEEVRFADEKTVQTKTFAQPHQTTYVRFVIVSAYEATGDRAAKDTSMAYMRVFGY